MTKAQQYRAGYETAFAFHEMHEDLEDCLLRLKPQTEAFLAGFRLFIWVQSLPAQRGSARALASSSS